MNIIFGPYTGGTYVPFCAKDNSCFCVDPLAPQRVLSTHSSLRTRYASPSRAPTFEEATMVIELRARPAAAQLQCETDTGIETVPLAQEVSFGSWQRGIPEAYWGLGAEELVRRVHAAREALGERAVVLGHHYQREDIIQFADERGDSFMLAQ